MIAFIIAYISLLIFSSILAEKLCRLLRIPRFFVAEKVPFESVVALIIIVITVLSYMKLKTFFLL